MRCSIGRSRGWRGKCKLVVGGDTQGPGQNANRRKLARQERAESVLIHGQDILAGTKAPSTPCSSFCHVRRAARVMKACFRQKPRGSDIMEPGPSKWNPGASHRLQPDFGRAISDSSRLSSAPLLASRAWSSARRITASCFLHGVDRGRPPQAANGPAEAAAGSDSRPSPPTGMND
jgi:hypothetical protein